MTKEKITMPISSKKIFTYRGKTLEELKKLDIREFAKLIPSRERRTLLRNSDDIQKYISLWEKRIERKKPVRTHYRDLVIVPGMVGMVIFIYNGRNFVKTEIVAEMVGHRLGEFAPTRGIVKHGAAGIGATRSSASRSVK